MEFMFFRFFSLPKNYHAVLGLNTLMLGLAACSFNTPSLPAETLRIQLEREPMSLDPTFVEDGVALQILNHVSQGLLGYGSGSKLELQLAESYQQSSDGKKYEFTLRKNLKWSDGQDVTVEDFVVAFRRALAPQSTAKLAPLLFPIRGAKEFHDAKAPAEALRVWSSNGKLVIELEKDIPYFPHLLTLPITYPIRSDILAAHQGNWPETGPVTGPYRIAAHQLNTALILERNPRYWGTPARIKEVEFKVITDESTAVHAFETGQLDILTRISSLDYPRLKKQGLVQTTPFLATYYIAFNCKKAPFNDVHLRRAVAAAIQKEEITEALGAGELPATSWIPKGLEGFFPYVAGERNTPEKSGTAKKVYPNPKFPKTFEIAFDESVRNQRIFEVIQQNLKNKLGVNVTLTHYDWKSYVRVLQTDPPAIYRMGWMAPILDPITHLRVFLKGERNNYTGCSDPRYDVLVDEIRSLAPGPVREAKIRVAQEIVLNELAAVVPIYHYVQNTGVSKRVQGFEMSLFGVLALHKFSIQNPGGADGIAK